MCSGTVANLYCVVIADIRSFDPTIVAIFFEIPVGLDAGRAKNKFYFAEDNPTADIGVHAMILVDTKVSGIINNTFIVSA